MSNLFLENKKVQYILKNTSVILSSAKQKDVLYFRRLIEIAQRKGFWWGLLGES